MGNEVREAESNIDADEDRTPLRNPKLRKHRSRDHSLIRLLNVDLKVLLGFAIIAYLIVLFMIHRLIIAVEHPQKPRVVTPFPAQRSLIFLSFKVITRRACIGELIALTLILEFVRVDGRYFMRHVCQDSDELKTYGWTCHNGQDYGRQMGTGSKLSEEMQTVHLFFYLADEDGNALSLSRETLNIRENSLLDDLEVHYSGFRTSHIHNLSDLVQQNLGAQFSAVRKFGHLQLSDTTDDSSNILVFQILGRISFTTDVAFISGTGVKDSRLKKRISSLTDLRLDSESISTGKAAVASLLGGIGYFYGQSKISVPRNSNVV
ncbi:unnamed protein product [Camellia sinensis]